MTDRGEPAWYGPRMLGCQFFPFFLQNKRLTATCCNENQCADKKIVILFLCIKTGGVPGPHENFLQLHLARGPQFVLGLNVWFSSRQN